MFLDELLQQALQEVVRGVPEAASLLARFPEGVWVADTSSITLPKAFAAVWAGTDGDDAAGVKVAARWNVQHGQLQLWLGPGRVHDQHTGVNATALAAGSVWLGDLGFFNLETFAAYQAQGVDFFSRYKGGTSVWTAAGQPLNLADYLAHTAPHSLDCPVLLGAERLPCRLLAFPVPLTVQRQRQARLRETARRKQQPVSPLAGALSGWTIYITSLAPDQLSAHEALTLGMTRWQIECLFKLWKSSGLLDEWRSADPLRIWVEFYGKLLALLVQHWLTLVSAWQRLDRSLYRAAQVIRKHAFHLATVLRDALALEQVLMHLAQTILHTCGMSKRNAHPLTFQYWLALVTA